MTDEVKPDCFGRCTDIEFCVDDKECSFASVCEHETDLRDERFIQRHNRRMDEKEKR